MLHPLYNAHLHPAVTRPKHVDRINSFWVIHVKVFLGTSRQPESSNMNKGIVSVAGVTRIRYHLYILNDGSSVSLWKLRTCYALSILRRAPCRVDICRHFISRVGWVEDPQSVGSTLHDRAYHQITPHLQGELKCRPLYTL